MNNMPGRRDRRSALRFQGLLKEKTKMPYKKWLQYITESIKAGSDIFKTNKDAIEKSISDQLEQKELSLIEFWKNCGYSDNKIDKLREVYAMSSVKYDDTYKEDKKVIKSLMKEIAQLS